ncbi:hypothetical protein KUTeg_013516 [Tegillarca granosa]|uniref:Uncharacterized protein n=1 Tax=Tegillarca granosa TaxID=220873 RepID=A0ABQ9EXC5_TEGGR|nr:hypothetical protein KUTeg_013516 [Tegillarca granosa]
MIKINHILQEKMKNDTGRNLFTGNYDLLFFLLKYLLIFESCYYFIQNQKIITKEKKNPKLKVKHMGNIENNKGHASLCNILYIHNALLNLPKRHITDYKDFLFFSCSRKNLITKNVKFKFFVCKKKKINKECHLHNQKNFTNAKQITNLEIEAKQLKVIDKAFIVP